MCNAKKINKDELNKKIEQIVKSKDSEIDTEIDEDYEETLDAILKRFLKENSDSKIIDQDEFLDAVRKFDLSSDDIDYIFDFFTSNGYQLEGNDDVEADFDESELKDFENDDEEDYDDEDLNDEDKEDEEIIEDSNFDAYHLENVKVTDNVKMYLKDIGKYGLLTPEEEKEVAMRIEQGDEDAKEDLIHANLRLVVSIAKHFIGRGMPLLDLIQEGNLGLMKAASKFDPDTGNKFSTYAVYWIRQAISNSINNCSRTVRLPAHVQAIITEISKTQDELEEKNGVAPTLEQLASATGYTTNELLMYQNANNTILSLDYVIDDENDTETLDLVADPEVTDPAALLKQDTKKKDLLKVLDTLSPVEKEIIILRYGLDDGECKSLEEIGKRVHMGRDKVRQVEIRH